jgi:hypothetical protein
MTSPDFNAAADDAPPPGPGSREAVVVIHGMGEQHRNQTMRDFVGVGPARKSVFESAVRGAANTKFEIGATSSSGIEPTSTSGAGSGSGVATENDLLYANPAPIADKDTSVYTIRWGGPEGKQKTDVYEVYWAPHYRETTFGAVLSWIAGMLPRQRSSVTTDKLRGLDATRPGAVQVAMVVVLVIGIVFAVLQAVQKPTWVVATLTNLLVLAIALLFLGWSGFCGLQAMLRCSVIFVLTVAVAVAGIAVCIESRWYLGLPAIAGALFVAIISVPGKFIAMSLGDVARYFSMSPNSVPENDSIRVQARKLIEELHDLKAGADDGTDAKLHFRYSRIIVVGHSLGSVIAYDAVHSAWRARHNEIPVPESKFAAHHGDSHSDIQRQRRFEELASAFHDVGKSLARPENCKRWIVSDLITLACPMAHAEATLARSADDLKRRFDAGELLSSRPPRPPFPGNTGIDDDAEELGLYLRRSDNSGARRLYHRTLFAFTSWTNVWISHDIVGGELPHYGGDSERGFGDEVTNVRCGDSKWLWNMIFRYPHSSYFTRSTRPGVKEASEQSLDVIRKIVDPHRRSQESRVIERREADK